MLFRKSRVFMVVLLALTQSIVAQAGDGGIGQLSYLHFGQDPGVVVFYVSGPHNNPPACAIPGRWAVNGTTPAGKVQVAGLLAAYSAGKAIKVYGKGTCVDRPDTETLSWFYTAP